MIHLLRLCPLLLFMVTATAALAEGFGVEASPAVQSISAGETATFSISVLPEGGFNSSVFLTVFAPTLNSTTVVITPPTLNAPYTPGATLSITATGNDLGTHQVVIEGRNGSYARYDTVTVIVTAGPEPSQWTIYHTGNSGLPSMLITAIEFDTTGGAWIGTDEGLAHAMPGEAPVRVEGTVGTKRIKAIAIDSSNAVWVLGLFGTQQDNKVFRYLNGEWTGYQAGDLQSYLSSAKSIAAAPDGSIWITTNDNGLLRFKDNVWEQFDTDDWGGVIGQHMSHIAISPQGEVWAPATGNNQGETGIIRFNGSFWTTYTPEELGVPENPSSVRQVAIGDSGQAWILDINGLIRIDGNGSEHRSLGFSPTTLGVGRDGRVWIGANTFNKQTLHGQLGTTWESFPLDSAGLSPDAQIWLIRPHVDGSVWVGTLQHGLAILDPGSGTVGVPSIEPPASSLHLALRPNPAAAEGMVTVSTTGGAARISLHDNLGRQIAVLFDGMLPAGESALPFDLSACPSGSYLLTVAVDGSATASRMVVVAR